MLSYYFLKNMLVLDVRALLDRGSPLSYSRSTRVEFRNSGNSEFRNSEFYSFRIPHSGIPHSAFGIPHSAFRHSAFGIRHSAFGIRLHSAFRIPVAGHSTRRMLRVRGWSGDKWHSLVFPITFFFLSLV